MGLLSFAKTVGAKIFGGTEAKAAPAEELKKEIEKHGLDASNVKIEVDGDKVKVSGATASTEQAEKIAIAIGNTVGVSTVENNIAPAKVEPESQFYTVKSGDILGKIAQHFYGDANLYPLIAKSNQLANPDALKAGTQLEIPVKS